MLAALRSQFGQLGFDERQVLLESAVSSPKSERPSTETD